MRKQGNPEKGELVVCEISKINPNSAYAKLMEYGGSGMIHVSEVAKRWVRNIREFVKENQLVVCKVLNADPGYISLSIKRVNKNQADRKLSEFKRERNAEKFLEQVGKKFHKDIDQTYEEVGFSLQENFGSLHKTFEIALKNPDLLTEKGIDSKWSEAIIETAKKSFVEKTYEFKIKLEIKSYASDGIEKIKSELDKISKKGFDVKYIAAAKYQVTGKGKNAREVKESAESACEEAIKSIENSGGEGSYSPLEK